MIKGFNFKFILDPGVVEPSVKKLPRPVIPLESQERDSASVVLEREQLENGTQNE